MKHYVEQVKGSIAQLSINVDISKDEVEENGKSINDLMKKAEVIIERLEN